MFYQKKKKHDMKAQQHDVKAICLAYEKRTIIKEIETICILTHTVSIDMYKMIPYQQICTKWSRPTNQKKTDTDYSQKGLKS